MQEAGLEPLVSYPGAREPWLSTCVACRNRVSPRLGDIRNRGQGGCIYCSSGGYDDQQPGAVYLMRHESFSAVKVGIRNAESPRIRDHERHGWTLIDEWRFEDGAVPFVIEDAVLDWWRGDLNAPIGCTPAQLPQGGYTETAPLSSVTPEATALYIDEITETHVSGQMTPLVREDQRKGR